MEKRKKVREKRRRIVSGPSAAVLANSWATREPVYFDTKGGSAEVIVQELERKTKNGPIAEISGQLTNFENEPTNPGNFQAEFNLETRRGKITVRY